MCSTRRRAPGLHPASRALLRRRARFWHDAGALLLPPTDDQLEAALAWWSPGALWLRGERATLPWRGLILDDALIVDALCAERWPDPGPRWLAQLLMPTPERLDDALARGVSAATAAAIAACRRHAPGEGLDLPTFLHRAAQLSVGDLGWARSRDVLTPCRSRAWPPAFDHLPAELHGRRAVRAVRGLRTPLAPQEPS